MSTIYERITLTGWAASAVFMVLAIISGIIQKIRGKEDWNTPLLPLLVVLWVFIAIVPITAFVGYGLWDISTSAYKALTAPPCCHNMTREERKELDEMIARYVKEHPLK